LKKDNKALKMQRNEIEQCTNLIIKWNQIPFGHEKDIIKKQLFHIMNPFMSKWISSIVSKRKYYYMSPEEILSKSWECFEFCLKHFKPKMNIPLPNHFYSYTKFLLATLSLEMRRKQQEEETNKIISEIQNPDRDDLSLLYGQLDELQQFRNFLPEEYVLVFDDTVMSLVPYSGNRIRRIDKTSLSYTKYHAIKKVFKVVVEYLLMR
jgi:hypothetical protein